MDCVAYCGSGFLTLWGRDHYFFSRQLVDPHSQTVTFNHQKLDQNNTHYSSL